MRSGRTNVVGVLVRNRREQPLAHLVGYETILGINEGLEGEGLVLAVIRAEDVASTFNSHSRVFEEHMLDALVVLAEVEDRIAQTVEALVGLCIWVETPQWDDVGCLRRDERFSGAECARRLLDLGYREVVYIAPPDLPADAARDYSRDERESGAMEVLGASPATVRRVEFDWNASASWGRTPELLSSLSRDTGVLVSQETQAKWLVHAASSLGVCPGRDFGLVCCDDSHELSTLWPGLSRVSFDRYGMGVEAAQMVTEALDGGGKPASRKVRGRWCPGNTAWGPR